MLALIVSLSLASLVTGTESALIGKGIEHLVSMAAFPFLKSKNLLERGVDYSLGFFFEYDELRRDNDNLRKQILGLKKNVLRKRELYMENHRLQAMLNFSRNEPRLTLEAAQVLENYKGLLRIDLGSRHHIEPAMCVVTEDGVVGVITEVSMMSSVVATLHHRNCKIGAMVQRNRVRAYDGVVHAGSDLTNLCTMEYIDMKDDVRPGDLVVTSPESLFPTGYPIGLIEAVHNSGSLWKTAELSPAVDPYVLDEVFVIRRAAAASEELSDAPAVAPAPATPLSQAASLPDERSIQEQYAP